MTDREIKQRLETLIKKYDIARSKPLGLNFYDLLKDLKDLVKELDL